MLQEIGEPVPPSSIVSGIDEANVALETIGLPLVIRPAYTLGGTGGGIANTLKNSTTLLQEALLLVHTSSPNRKIYSRVERT
ncbi:MAG: hypothetical protein CM1200mP3_18200 [Chloroflexota bacterium]|nr:MAG: hypothetical protein CM1200mP3_18200 [Chloroflexota bacterium]